MHERGIAWKGIEELKRDWIVNLSPSLSDLLQLGCIIEVEGSKNSVHVEAKKMKIGGARSTTRH